MVRLYVKASHGLTSYSPASGMFCNHRLLLPCLPLWSVTSTILYLFRQALLHLKYPPNRKILRSVDQKTSVHLNGCEHRPDLFLGKLPLIIIS